MNNSRFLLGEEWLVTFVRKLDAEGVPEKEITDPGQRLGVSRNQIRALARG
jgi:hypothetical protein